MRLQPSRSTQQRGFSLIQVSIILAVAALILAATLPGRQAGDYNQKAAETIRKLQKIEEAMKGFMALNGRRPCPADGQYTTTSQYFGVEATTPATSSQACKNGTPAAPLGPDASTGYVVGGTIPTRTLGLSDDYALDGWGRRFTYVVDARAAKGDLCFSLQKNINYRDGFGAVTIKDGSGNIKDHTMYAYISYGSTGDGAWPSQSGTRIDTGVTTADMLANSFNSAFTNELFQEEKTPTFDDIVYYSTPIKNTCCLSSKCNAQTEILAEGSGKQFTTSSNVSTAYDDGDIAGNKDSGGFSLAIGDVNGDGYPDLIIGAPYFNGGKGAVYVIFGQSAIFPVPLSLNYAVPNNSDGSLNTYITGGKGFRIDGINAGDYTGFSVATGDFDGDGISDIIISAPLANGTCGASVGHVYVIYGRSSWSSSHYSLSTDFNQPGNNLQGVDIYRDNTSVTASGFGTAVAAGDVNADGVADVVIGSSADSNVYVVYGNSTYKSTPTYTLDLETGLVPGTNGFKITNAYSGSSVFGTPIAIGNIKTYPNDGSNDIIIAQPNITNTPPLSLFVMHGRGTNWATYLDATTHVLDASSSTNALKLTNSQVSSVAVGNVTGHTDGTQDLVAASPNPSGTPSVYVIQPGSLASGVLTGEAHATLTGYAMQSGYVPWMSLAVGDINGDGQADIIFGEPYTSTVTCTNAGYVYAVFGSTSITGTINATNRTPTTTTPGGFYVHGLNARDVFGSAVAVGNITGNTTGDLIIGAPVASYTNTSTPAATNVGTNYIIRGRTSNWPVVGSTGNYHFTAPAY